jgi:hypothetical protein
VQISARETKVVRWIIGIFQVGQPFQADRMAGRGPEAELRADRGLVHDLLGNRENAKKDYEHARDKGVNDEWLRDRLRRIRDAEEREKKEAEKKEKEKKEREKQGEPPV